jgi:hypothetical protein
MCFSAQPIWSRCSQVKVSIEGGFSMVGFTKKEYVYVLYHDDSLEFSSIKNDIKYCIFCDFK